MVQLRGRHRHLLQRDDRLLGVVVEDVLEVLEHARHLGDCEGRGVHHCEEGVHHCGRCAGGTWACPPPGRLRTRLGAARHGAARHARIPPVRRSGWAWVRDALAHAGPRAGGTHPVTEAPRMPRRRRRVSSPPSIRSRHGSGPGPPESCGPWPAPAARARCAAHRR